MVGAIPTLPLTPQADQRVRQLAKEIAERAEALSAYVNTNMVMVVFYPTENGPAARLYAGSWSITCGYNVGPEEPESPEAPSPQRAVA